MSSNKEDKYISLFKDLIDPLFAGIDPGRLIKDAVFGRDFSNYNRIFVIGAGKASVVMAKAIEDFIPNIEEGHIIFPDNQNSPDFNVISYTAASHPFPSVEGVKGSRKVLKIVDKAGKGDLVISLISGGGSALMPLPVEGLNLKQKIDLSKQLIRSGANINEINVVRKHLSKIKGGHLARAVYPADCLNLVISDVVGDDLSTIASGPLSPDPSSLDDAIKVLKKYDLEVPTALGDSKNETPDFSDPCFKNIETHILANHETAAKAAGRILQGYGEKVLIMDTNLSEGVERAVERIFNECVDPERLYIYSGETTVNVKGKGFGGRNQEFVLLFLNKMLKNQSDYVVMSLATDGVDGFCPEDIAGVVAGPSTIDVLPEISPFLYNNDSYNYFKKTGGLIKTGPTGNNMGDIIFIKPL